MSLGDLSTRDDLRATRARPRPVTLGACPLSRRPGRTTSIRARCRTATRLRWRAGGPTESPEPKTLVSNTCAAPTPGAHVGALRADLGDQTGRAGRRRMVLHRAAGSTSISNFTLFRTLHMVTGSYWSTPLRHLPRASGVPVSTSALPRVLHHSWASCWDRGAGSRTPWAGANRVSASGLEFPRSSRRSLALSMTPPRVATRARPWMVRDLLGPFRPLDLYRARVRLAARGPLLAPEPARG